MSTHHSQEEEKRSSWGLAGIMIVVFCFLGIMPVLVWSTLPPTSSYVTEENATSLVATAAATSGLQICSSNGILLNIQGAENAQVFALSPDCKTANSGNTISVYAIGFSSSAAQANAIAKAQDTFKNWQVTNTEAFTSETSVIIVTGPPGNPGVSAIGKSLQAQGAQSIQ
jgi:hypothetical protein